MTPGPVNPLLISQSAVEAAAADKSVRRYDGRSNLLEFALHGNPSSGVNDGKLRTVVATVGVETTLTMTLPIRTGAAFSGSGDLVATVDGVTYKIQGSTALTDFVSANISEVTPALSADMPILTGAAGSPAAFLS